MLKGVRMAVPKSDKQGNYAGKTEAMHNLILIKDVGRGYTWYCYFYLLMNAFSPKQDSALGRVIKVKSQ